MSKKESLGKVAQRQSTKRIAFLEISDMGAVSLHGIGRSPITLYVEQWEQFLLMVPEIRRFLNVDAAYLSQARSAGSTVSRNQKVDDLISRVQKSNRKVDASVERAIDRERHSVQRPFKGG